MPKIKFYPQGEFEVQKGMSVLEAALVHKVTIYHTCGGNASCSTCRVRVINGAKNLSIMDNIEKEVLDTFDLKEPFRLGCQALIRGDVEVEVPDRDKPCRDDKIKPLSDDLKGKY